MKNLLVTKDSESTALYSRVISDSTGGKLAGQGLVYTIPVPSDAMVAICSGAVPFLISDNTFTYPSAVGADIPNGVLLSPGAIDVEGLTNLYIASSDTALLNIEFYRILG